MAASTPTRQSAPMAAGPRDLGAGLDRDVRAEDDRAVDHRVRVDAAALLGPDPGSDLFAWDVHAHVVEHGVQNRVAELVDLANCGYLRDRASSPGGADLRARGRSTTSVRTSWPNPSYAAGEEVYAYTI